MRPLIKKRKRGKRKLKRRRKSQLPRMRLSGSLGSGRRSPTLANFKGLSRRKRKRRTRRY